MLAAIGRPGLWHRAGMDGGLSGLDWAAALASLPGGLDMDAAKRLLAVAESAFLAAWHHADSSRKKH